MTYAFTNEKIASRGEDAVFHDTAEACALCDESLVTDENLPETAKISWAGVCDGLGGMGSSKYLQKDGTYCTEARIASNFYAEYINEAMKKYAPFFRSTFTAEEIWETMTAVKDTLYSEMLQELARKEAEGEFGSPAAARTVHRFPSTLPLISYGSSSQMVTFILLAMILRVSEQDMKGLEKRPYTFGF